MKAFALGLICGLIFLSFSGGILWYLSYSTEDQFSGQIESSLAAADITIYNADKNPGIDGSSRLDLLCGLAYAQALNDPWTVAVYRQTAVGRLGEWFGKDVRVLDQHVSEVGIPYFARLEYKQLQPEVQKEMDHFTSCMNEALQSQNIAERDEFVLLKIPPETWEPWDSIAIYRLLAWTQSEVEVDTLVNIENGALISFIENKKKVADWLRLSGQKHHYAWTAESEGKVRLGTRLVYGTSADSPLLAASLHKGQETRQILCYKGTVACPFISEKGNSFFHMPNSHLNIVTQDLKAGREDSWPIPKIEKLIFRDGEEELVERRLKDGLLFLDERPDTTGFGMDTVFVYTTSKWTPSDTLLVLDDTVRTNVVRWQGFADQSDQADWLNSILGTVEEIPTEFPNLVSKVGLAVKEDGSIDDWGRAGYSRRLNKGIFLANSEDANHLIARLNEIAEIDSLLNGDWFRDSKSIWSQTLRDQLRDLLATAEDSGDETLGLAARYVRNWDGYFSDDNIGASIFSKWMSIYKKENGDWPYFPPPEDTLNSPPDSQLLQSSLKEAFDNLRNTVDISPDKWMWNVVQPGSLYKTVWSADVLEQKPPGSGTTNIYPIQNIHGGHFSTLRWQSSEETDNVSAAWYVSASTDPKDDVLVFDDANRPRNLFGRLSATSSAQEFRLSPNSPVSDKIVRIKPADR